MRLLDALIDASIRHRVWVLFFTALAALWAAFQIRHLKLDAFPDLTSTQVQIVTTAPALGAEEVERLVTNPIERALGGVPHTTLLRSLSRPGVSSVTLIFDEQADLWLARQWVRERLDSTEIPMGVGRPELAPPSTGLGEVWQFTLHSDRHSRAELYRIFERDVAPRLRGVQGVVEVNAWGAGAPQIDVVFDPWSLANRGLSFEGVLETLRASLGLASGGHLDAQGDERIALRATSNPTTPEEIAHLTIAHSPEGPIRVVDVGEAVDAGALTVGVSTAGGRGEALYAVAQLIAGGDARTTVDALVEASAQISTALPEGVTLQTVYNREKLVNNTLLTVVRSLTEGGLLVIFVLFVMLGDVRAGLVVASVIPLAMLGALAGLVKLDMSGNLMSLGAIDFGLVVDGAVVVVEGIVALHLAPGELLPEAIARRTRSVARPVLFSLCILLVVYLPILAMHGTEGKLFKPMASTVLLAIGTALLLSFTYVPALATLIVQPSGTHTPKLGAYLAARYKRTVGLAMSHPGLASAAALLTMLLSAFTATGLGVAFIPRLEEGDLVVQAHRPPGITPDAAVRESTRLERVLLGFPEVLSVATRIGSPAVATDPMGMAESDTILTLTPKDEWQSAHTFEGLVDAMALALEQAAPGAHYTFTQPIEMRFNELLEGVPSDVGIEIYGHDIPTLLALGAKIANLLQGIEGAADVRAPSVQGLPTLDVRVDPDATARAGVTPQEILDVVQAVQVGHEAGVVQREAFHDKVLAKLKLDPGVQVADLPIQLAHGATLPVGALAGLTITDVPELITHKNGTRIVLVQANVRGRDLAAFVREAQHALQGLALPEGTRVAWVGKLEQMRASSTRTALLLPVVLLLVLALLRSALGSFRPVWLISLNVPLAVSGGVFALALRGLPISMSAIVGFIALFGIAVMNGLVLVSRMLEHLQAGLTVAQAVKQAAEERFRPVLTTAIVAGLGFVPMALAQSMGAEVQRPLATVVIGGLLTSTLLTLIVIPAIAPRFLRTQPAQETPVPRTPQ